ncbi:ABC-type multidrug transport system ATPase subunit [Paenibacillus castaneae]|uniref:ABC transporter ATP-binding protein n=1 Tax=Paenibacillus castaneae TaxID=474957 RepID=UPI000C9B8FF3|nr:ABC transporter ATP-binding protein [Paenibacillus castaneae]NIK76796.1 ABC-type multidrug transport system ATPase subunit [Paenibacillus castaneae]
MIKTIGLRKVYNNDYEAVKHLDLNVGRGDIYGFLGPNGAGKTTTIRMLTGLIEPTEGMVFFNDREVSKGKQELKNNIGVLPESHGYYEWMTGKQYLLFFASLYGMNKASRIQRTNDVLEMVDLTEKANIRIHQYSRGMKQRLGIARTLLHEPQIIFLDEPTLGLDPQGQKDIENILVQLNKEQGVTIFITSHLLKDIERICNRVAIVQRGSLLVEDTIPSLLTTYEAMIEKENVNLEDVFFFLTDEKRGESKHDL